MRNCVVLGSGRSGTSLLAAMIVEAGYFGGENLYPGREANPLGFYESPEVNDINETILHSTREARIDPDVRSWGRLWLARVADDVEMTCPRDVRRRIECLVRQAPFCLKDPRFSYTLPVWRPYLSDAGVLCLFREPARTAHSVLKECATAEYLTDLEMDFSRAIDIWFHVYRYILRRLAKVGDWMFLHYDQLFDRTAVRKVESFLDAKLVAALADRRLRRSENIGHVSAEVQRTYDQLCELADYDAHDVRGSSPAPVDH